MKKRHVIFVCVVILVLGVVTYALAQFASQSGERELGYYDHQTGVFTPLQSDQAAEPAAEPAAVVPTTGTLVFKFTITDKTPLLKNGALACTAKVSVTDPNGFSATEKGVGIASLVSGDTYTCTATINYSWLLGSPTKDTITVQSEDVTDFFGYQFTAMNSTGTSVYVSNGRDSSQATIAPFLVPANGATTDKTISITL